MKLFFMNGLRGGAVTTTSDQSRSDVAVPWAESGAGIADHFRSVDSVPREYATARPAWLAPLFFVLFTVLSGLLVEPFLALHDQLLPNRPNDLLMFTGPLAVSTLPIRLFFVLFFVCYAVCCRGSLLAKAYLLGSLLVKFFAACVLIDLVFLWLREGLQLGAAISISAQQITAGIAALAVFPHSVMAHASLPVQERPAELRPHRRLYSNYLILAAVALVSIAFAWWLAQRVEVVGDLRAVALLGGLGPGVFLVVQVFAIQLYLLGRRR